MGRRPFPPKPQGNLEQRSAIAGKAEKKLDAGNYPLPPPPIPPYFLPSRTFARPGALPKVTVDTIDFEELLPGNMMFNQANDRYFALTVSPVDYA